MVLAQAPDFPGRDLFRSGDEVRIVSTGSSADIFGSIFVDTSGRIGLASIFAPSEPSQNNSQTTNEGLILAEKKARELPTDRMRQEALAVIAELSESLADGDDPSPVISPSLPGDGSFMIEIVQDGVRAGFTVEPEDGQSGWYYASFDGSRLVSASGSLGFLTPRELLKRLAADPSRRAA